MTLVGISASWDFVMFGPPICRSETGKIIKIEVIEIRSYFPFGDVSRELQEGLRVVASCSYETG